MNAILTICGIFMCFVCLPLSVSAEEFSYRYKDGIYEGALKLVGVRDLSVDSRTDKFVLDDEDVEEITHVRICIENLLKQIDKSKLVGQEAWYEELHDWVRRLERVTISRSGVELLGITEFAIKFTKTFFGRDDVNEAVSTIVEYMYYIGPSVSRVVAKKIENMNGDLDAETTELVFEFFADPHFHGESLWAEDIYPAIDIAGFFVAIFNQKNLVEDYGLEKLGSLTSCCSSDAYFDAYLEGGEGMRVLKLKFKLNRTKIENLYHILENFKKVR